MVETEQKPDEQSAPNIRTMRTDAELYVKEKKLSSLQVAATNYAGQSSQTKTTQTQSYKSFIIIAALVLIVGGGGLIAWKLLAPSNTPLPTIQEPSVPAPLIKPDSENILSFKEVNPGGLLVSLNAERAKTFRNNLLIYLPVKIELRNGAITYLGAKNFLEILGLKAPENLLETLTDDLSIFLFSKEQVRDVVIVMRAKNFDQAFSSLLSWERTMVRDWHNLLSSLFDIATTPLSFHDEIIKNNDARLLKASDGQTLLGYSIFNKKFVIIATSREALETALGRIIELPPK